MFIKIILSYLLGYLKISVEGYYIERFINICKNKNITIWNLKRNKEIKIFWHLHDAIEYEKKDFVHKQLNKLQYKLLSKEVEI